MFRWSVLSLLFLAASTPASEVLPLEKFFRHAEYDQIAISPGGDYLAVTMPQEGTTGVAIVDISNFPEMEVLVNITPSGSDEHLGGLFWATNDRLLMTSTRQQGSLAVPVPTGRIYATNADGSRQRLLQSGWERAGQAVARFVTLAHRLPDDEHHVLVIERTHDRERPVARRMNILREGRARIVARSPLSRGNLGTDADGNVVFASGINDDYEPEFAWRPDPESDWRTFENPFQGSVSFYGFNAERTHFYIGSRDRRNMGVYRFNVEDGSHEPVLGDDQFEVLSPIWNQERTRLIGAVFNTPRPEARFIDPDDSVARIIQGLREAIPGFDMLLSGFTDDGRFSVVRLFSDREPGVFMLLDTETMSLDELVAIRQWVPADSMAEMEPIQFTARDGLELHGFLTLPPGIEEPRELPLVVEVHGGPHGPFDRWHWQPWVQAMASRGYAVLQVNFRGSGGYGQQFEEAGYTHWGDKMQDDLKDGAKWVIEQGIAHPDRVCISGASYGGYSAMMSVVRHPDFYQCAFAFVGVYDLERAKREGNIAQRIGFGRAYLERALGTDEDRLRAHSPSRHAERIKADLLIAHGSRDEQAHYNQYHVMVDALEDAGIPHQKLFVRGEGHGFYELDNNVKLYSKALELFDRNIGSGWNSESAAQ
jgi:dienelactone hydrolase